MTLTEAAISFRRLVKITAILFALFILYKASTDVIEALLPKRPRFTPTPTPTLLFGKLPKLQIETVELSSTQRPTWVLDLVNVQLPSQPTQAKIYPILSAPYGFLAKDRAKDLAKNFDFPDSLSELSATEFYWSDGLRSLKMDAASLNFTYQYQYLADPSVFLTGAFFSEEAAQNLAAELLKVKNLLGGGQLFGGTRGTDLADGPKKNKLLRFEDGKLSPAESLAAASSIRVDFFRQPLDNLPLMAPRFSESLVNILLSGTTNDPRQKRFTQILELNYAYWVINRTQAGSYPLRTASSAWQQLQDDPKPFLVYLKKEDGAEIEEGQAVISFVVKKVYLGYYDSAVFQKFVQPIWVFEGKANLDDGTAGDWAAYAPAVAEGWVE